MSILSLDQSLTFKLYEFGRSSPLLQDIIFVLASAFIYSLPIILIVLLFRSFQDKLNSIKIFLIAALAWQVLANFVGDWLYGLYAFRQRPFAELGIKEFLFEQPEKAFPSDHSAVIFGVMLAFFYYKYPKIGWLFLTVGILGSLGRVMIGFHYLGDVLAGWSLGAIAFLIIKSLDGPLNRYLTPVANWLPGKKGSL